MLKQVQHDGVCDGDGATSVTLNLFQGPSKKIVAMLAMLCVGMAGPALAADLATAPVRSITASGVAERKVAPDEAHVHVTVEAMHPKLDAAKLEHDKKLRDVMGIAKNAGIAEAQLRTENSAVQPQYTYENSRQVFKGYSVVTNLDITVKHIDAVGGLLEKLSNAGLENGDAQQWGNLINVTYTIADPDKLRDEMLAEAIKNARAKAENMAAAADAHLGSVIQINEGGSPQFNFPVPMMARAKLAMAAAEPVAPPVGEQQVNANVTVIFELKE